MQEVDKGKRFRVGGVLLLIFSLLYLPSLFHWLSNDNIGKGILRMGVIEDSVNVDGVLIRDEVLLEPSAANGKLIPEAGEGERIPAFGNVATISDKVSQSLLKQLEDVNEQIIRVQNEIAKKTEFFSEDIAKIDKTIGEKVLDIIKLYNSNTMTGLNQITLEVDRLIEKKAAIAGDDEENSVIKDLKQKKSSIQQQINSKTSQIKSKFSGIVSYVIDEYENILTPDSIKDLTPEILEGIDDKKASRVAAYEDIVAGKPFAKVIKGNFTYIASVIDTEKAAKFQAGQTIKVRLNAIGAIVNGLIHSIEEKAPGKSIITVRIDRYMEELSSVRKTNIDLINYQYEGLKIPVKCLYSPDSQWKRAKVMLIRANCATEREVEIVFRDEEYAIITSPENEVRKTITLYDTYILNPENVKEGQIILR